MFTTRLRHLAWMGAAVVAGSTAACDRGEGPDPDETAAVETPTVENVVEEHPQMVGKTLTLYGEADEVYGDQAFVLEGNQWLFDHDLLVLTREAIDLEGEGIDDDDKLAVTGTIHSLVITEIEKELDWDLDTEIEVEFENKPVLIADSITATREMVRWTDEPKPSIVSLWAVYAMPDPDALEGKIVEFATAPVLSKTAGVLWIGNEHAAQLMVAPPKHEHSDAEPGDRVMIQGTLRKMPDAKTAMSKWNIPEQFETQLAEEPFYVAATMVKTLPKEPEKSATAPTRKAGGQDAPGG